MTDLTVSDIVRMLPQQVTELLVCSIYTLPLIRGKQLGPVLERGMGLLGEVAEEIAVRPRARIKVRVVQAPSVAGM
jgi:hypothetical protein